MEGVLFLLQIAYDAGIHYHFSMCFLVGLLGLYLMNTLCLFPKYTISEERSNDDDSKGKNDTVFERKH